jgi:hypothetical protein
LLHEGNPLPAYRRPADAYEGPDMPPAPVQDVEALEDKQLSRIIDLERAEEHIDLLRSNADQE